jgi:hypothetical protein
MIGRIAKALWPKCDEERRKLGYPKITETKPRISDWAEVCAPCEARKRQKEKEGEEYCENVRAEPKRWTIVTPSQLDFRDLHVGRRDHDGYYEVSGSQLETMQQFCDPKRGTRRSLTGRLLALATERTRGQNASIIATRPGCPHLGRGVVLHAMPLRN